MPLPTTDPRRARTVRVSDAEWEEITEAALRAHEYPSEFMRRVALEAARAVLEREDDVRRAPHPAAKDP